MSLLDVIPIWVALVGGALGVLCVFGLIRCRVLTSVADPCVLILFQVAFTFWILLLTGILPPGDIVGYLAFFTILSRMPLGPARSKPFINSDEWISFSYVLFFILVVANAYLVLNKGFLLLQDDLSSTRLEFFQQWGIFKRLNAFGEGVLGLSGLYFWSAGRKKAAALYLLTAALLALTTGSRAGLITLFFAYGAYLRFNPQLIKTKALILVGASLSISSVALFYLMFRVQFLFQFAYRMLSYCDGPVYFFYSKLAGKILYDPLYSLDSFLVAARVKPDLSYLSLGRVLDTYFLGVDTPLMGPNPQFSVEAHVMYGAAFLVWYILVAIAFAYLRRRMATPFSFFLASSIAGPLLVDSQYAGSQVFSALLSLGLICMFLVSRKIFHLAVQQAPATTT